MNVSTYTISTFSPTSPPSYAQDLAAQALAGAHASRPAERPSTSPTIDSMLTQAREHRARCDALLEALGAPVCQGVVNTSSKES